MTKDERLLKLAKDTGDRLLPAFNSPTGMPLHPCQSQTGKVDGNISNPAETGTLLLEFGMLSKLTGQPSLLRQSQKAFVATYERRSGLGLVGSGINVETGEDR